MELSAIPAQKSVQRTESQKTPAVSSRKKILWIVSPKTAATMPRVEPVPGLPEGVFTITAEASYKLCLAAKAKEISRRSASWEAPSLCPTSCPLTMPTGLATTGSFYVNLF
eukprot:TRINITY_DN17044_c0_g1_i1.p1 TRINITY_DN17044_c0_g1~~TRINITY_DN17044_c0_g1_i1.p1  ORF type:complete len:111 (-),score=11.95 TRINITY_DN17044_c0_g1_i1:45-377(-)